MMNTSTKMRILFAGIVTCTVAATALIRVGGGSKTAEAPNQMAQKTEVPQPKEQPMIIWHYSGYADSPQSVELALSSGLITHVSIGAPLHRKDRYHKKDAEILKAIATAKNSGVKLIWIRWLWPGYAVEQSRVQDLFDPNYYIQEITALRAEAAKVGADFLDIHDAVEAIWMLPQKPMAGQIFNLCSGKGVKIADMLEMMIKASGVDVKVEVDTSRIRGNTDVSKIYGSYEKLKQYYGWHPRISLRESVKNMV